MKNANEGERCSGIKCRFHTAAVSAMWSTALAVASATGLPALAADAPGESTPNSNASAVADREGPAPHVSAGLLSADHDGPAPDVSAGLRAPVSAYLPATLGLKFPAFADGWRESIAEHVAADVGPLRLAADASLFQLAQFQLPEAKPGLKPAAPPPDRFQYAYGSDPEISYRRNKDLNNQVRDDTIVSNFTLFALATYRPTTWLDLTGEVTFERPYNIQEEPNVLLPSGERVPGSKRRANLIVDQAFVRIHRITGPFEFLVGRRLFEDSRLWLYDFGLDAATVRLRHGNFVTDASIGRENLRDLDLISTSPRGRINRYILHSEYRGIEDHRFAAYAITLKDSQGGEGKPFHTGVRAIGRPSDQFNYWSDFSLLRGEDEERRDYRGWAFDVGATYRFTQVPVHPTVTASYAYGSGDNNPNDRTIRRFRQTGMESNEGRFAGVTPFKYYGQAFAPELSNLKIFTLGLGFRLARSAFLDLAYHKYRLDEIRDDIRSSRLTALLNQTGTTPSKDVGSGIDIVVGMRNLFGFKRLGFDLAAGMFFPGNAYRIREGNPANPTFRKGDKMIDVLATFILY